MDLPQSIHPDTGQVEPRFRWLIRDLLDLSWDTRDEAIFAEIRRLKKLEREAIHETISHEDAFRAGYRAAERAAGHPVDVTAEAAAVGRWRKRLDSTGRSRRS